MQRTFDLVCEKFPSLRYYYQTEEPGNGLLRDQRQRRQVFYRQIHSRFMYCQRQILLRIFLPTGRACLRGLARSQEKPSARNRMPRLCLKNGRRKTPILAAVSMNMWSWIKSDRQPKNLSLERVRLYRDCTRLRPAFRDMQKPDFRQCGAESVPDTFITA